MLKHRSLESRLLTAPTAERGEKAPPAKAEGPRAIFEVRDRWRLPGRKAYYETRLGTAYVGDSLDLMKGIADESVDLIMTSPPFALTRKKDYGNVPPEKYVKWFRPFADEFWRILKPTGSAVIHIGTSWQKGKPFKNLYVYELILDLCSNHERNFNLAQEFFWYNPARLPSPAEWVTVRRVRAKDAVDFIWWLCKSENAKANNRNVLKNYSESMKNLLKNGYKAKHRPSGHVISRKFSLDHGGAIASNMLAVPTNIANMLTFSNTSSADRYLRLCREHGDIASINPARYPEDIPEFFIKFLTDPADKVLDPFAGSNTTGYVAEMQGRRWMAFELNAKYLIGSIFRFDRTNILKCENAKALDILTAKHEHVDEGSPARPH